MNEGEQAAFPQARILVWPTCTRATRAARRAEPMRVIDYTLEDAGENPRSYRLFTTLLDPDEARALDLAMAYAHRWEIEITFDELKTHQRGPRTVPGSKSPDLVHPKISDALKPFSPQGSGLKMSRISTVVSHQQSRGRPDPEHVPDQHISWITR